MYLFVLSAAIWCPEKNHNAHFCIHFQTMFLMTSSEWTLARNYWTKGDKTTGFVWCVNWITVSVTNACKISIYKEKKVFGAHNFENCSHSLLAPFFWACCTADIRTRMHGRDTPWISCWEAKRRERKVAPLKTRPHLLLVPLFPISMLRG